MNSLAFALLITFVVGTNALSTFEKDVTLTEQEGQTLIKFKKLMEDKLPHEYMKEDIFLVRWLRVKNWNIPRAEQALLANLKWREENNMDTILQEDFSDMKSKFRFSLESRAKDLTPTLYAEAGTMDFRAAIVQGKLDRLLRYVDYVYEEATTLVRDMGKKYQNVTRGHLIVNAQGYNLIQQGCPQCIAAVLRVLLSFEEHYPYFLDRLWVFNTPAIFTPLLEAMKPVFSKNTREALQIFGSNKQKNLEQMLKLFYKEEIPVQLGGTKVYKMNGDEDYDLDNFY